MATALLVSSLVTAACGAGTAESPSRTIGVDPQNSALLVGVNRVSLALLDEQRRPLAGARASLDIGGAGGTFETRPLEDIGPQYGGIPIYVTHANLPQVGEYLLTVHATKGGTAYRGEAHVRVVEHGSEIAVGARAPAVSQPIITTPGVTIAQLDSGSPPDPWHDATVADGLARHMPMVLFFGEPGFCKSQTCGPTVDILRQLYASFGGRMLFEHIEDHFPAAPDETGVDNPGFDAFGLRTEPWVYMVNSRGIVSDRFEGPVTLHELQQSAAGTLAGRVPAVDVTL